MVDFGFGLVPSSRINLDLFDREKFEELAAIEPDVRKCMACGSCTAVCTAGQFIQTSLGVMMKGVEPGSPQLTEDELRAAIEELHNGHPDKALGLLKSCQLCGKCSMVCPRGINTRHLILSIAKVYGNK